VSGKLGIKVFDFVSVYKIIKFIKASFY